MCIGCHQHFCMIFPKIDYIDSNFPNILCYETKIFDINLGERKAKVQLAELTPQGNHKRKKVMKEVRVQIHATCYNFAHRHLISNHNL